MIPYWTLFWIFAFAAFVGGEKSQVFAQGGNAVVRGPKSSAFLVIGACLITLLIGLRYQIGGDWGAYAFMYKQAVYRTLPQMLRLGDPGYEALTWAAQRTGGELLSINLTCGAIFSWGLYRLIKIQPEPWLALLVAVPYLIIVVAMGYTRQAVALGFLMAGLARLMSGGRAISFLPYVVAATLFHKTAIVVLPLALVGVYRQRIGIFFLVIAGGYLLYTSFLQSSMGGLMQSYVEASYSSHGALTRLMMTSSAALLFFMFRRRLAFNEVEGAIWRNFSAASLLLMAALSVIPSSTVIDRLALYVLPLQFVVLGRLPLVFKEVFSGRAAVILYSAAVMYVWLNYADNARFWVPYHFYPI